ncbi:hypothetical protein BGZ83_002261 [Gryganskiella cystojenkinii]|nr:hypothetical protein BGZ83_002261 [Gryganskiella cystojenkinii]
MTTVTSGSSIPEGTDAFNARRQETVTKKSISTSNNLGDLSELDMEELMKIESSNLGDVSSPTSSEEGSSPTSYSNTRTIRPKKGRQMLSSMTTTTTKTTTFASSSSDGSVPSVSSTSTTEESTNMADIQNSSTSGNADKAESDRETRTARVPGGLDGAGAAGSVGLSGARRSFPSLGLYQGLGRVQAVSALAFAGFCFIHMVPPALAAFGGIDLANKAILWGRVYYQEPIVEGVLVLGSLNIHIFTGLARALIRLVWKGKAWNASRPQKNKQVTSSSSESTDGSIKSTKTTTATTTTTRSSRTSSSSGGSASTPGAFPYHRLIGWLLTPLVIGHINAMRAKPFNILGDSSLIDYWYVTHIHRIGHRPPYILLVGFLTYHMYGGAIAAYNAVLPKGSKKRVQVQEMIRSRKTRAAVAGVVTTVVMVGAYRIFTAEGTIPMAKLYGRLGF